ncbi:MAG: hypothetical protein HYY51_01665 [Candidatus Magasanikbacteria bacterium]|nr:hypothetical protein [Candidatus Magasanikbacteria bacterium]
MATDTDRRGSAYSLVFFIIAMALFFASHPAAAQTCPLGTQQAYKAPGASSVYYITDACTKRAFTNSKIFFTYFPKWDYVAGAPVQLFQSIPNDPLGFMPYGPLYDPQYGALVKIVNDPKVYLLLGGEKYWIRSEEVFNALNYQWDWIEDIDTRLLDKYATGSEITDTTRHPNFTLIKYADSPNVYRLEDKNAAQIKRHITDETVFAKLGFRLDRIVTIQKSEAYPDGAPLTDKDVKPAPRADEALPWGELACEKNPNPVFTRMIVEPAMVTNILPPPNIHKASGHLKTHSYISTTKIGVPIYAPVDMELFKGSHYVGGPYYLDFRISCEVRLRVAHIDPVQKIKDFFPAEAILNAPETEIKPAMKFKAGDVIAYVYQDQGVLNVGLDFGVYHSERPNKYVESSDPIVKQSDINTNAVCPYSFFTKILESAYRAKFNLEIHEGMKKDGSSFCE